jgi:hypothetical protein
VESREVERFQFVAAHHRGSSRGLPCWQSLPDPGRSSRWLGAASPRSSGRRKLPTRELRSRESFRKSPKGPATGYFSSCADCWMLPDCRALPFLRANDRQIQRGRLCEKSRLDVIRITGRRAVRQALPGPFRCSATSPIPSDTGCSPSGKPVTRVTNAGDE